MKATTAIFIDKSHPKAGGKIFLPTDNKEQWLKENGKCAVTIRVTFNRIKKYYATNYSLTISEFEKVMSERPREPFKTIKLKLSNFEKKAADIIDCMPVFTFHKFDEIYKTNQDAADSVHAAFTSYIDDLKKDNRLGTAISYENARNSFSKYKEGLKFADIDPKFLKAYEAWMISNDLSKTTVGIYTRSLRAIFNSAKIDKSLYPFGSKKGLYSIPKGAKTKKALLLAEVATIFNYQPVSSAEAAARDYWIFIYLCNGLNVKDLCLLKWKNIDGDILTFERAKTIRTKDESQFIKVSLKPEAKAIIKKMSVPAISPEAYIFPHLKPGMNQATERKTIQQLTKTINKYMKRIAKCLDISKPTTTYYARHSFATILKNSGASTEFISEALGHSDTKTTQGYLSSFEEKAIHETTDALTAFN
jgi:integrase/recombinase XerD